MQSIEHQGALECQISKRKSDATQCTTATASLQDVRAMAPCADSPRLNATRRAKAIPVVLFRARRVADSAVVRIQGRYFQVEMPQAEEQRSPSDSGLARPVYCHRSASERKRFD